MAYRRWKPSRSKAREFARLMSEIEEYCDEHGISHSLSSDSYYFEIGGQEYRVSNHSVEASYRNSGGKWHMGGRDADVVYIHASKTRIIEIYEDLKAGYKLDGRGYRKVGN